MEGARAGPIADEIDAPSHAALFHERLRLRVLFSLVRLVAGTNDSLVVNNRLSVLVPVYGVDARGRRHMIAGLRWLKRDLGLGPVIVPSGLGKRTGQWRSVI